jgi:uncharacterized protein
MGRNDDVAVMQRAYDAFNTGDLDTLNEVFDENAAWHLPGKSKYADDYQGADAILGYFGQIAQDTGGTFRAELQHLTGDDNGEVVGFQHSTGDRNGRHLDVTNCIVFQLRDGKIVDGKEHFHDLYAWDEFWS